MLAAESNMTTIGLLNVYLKQRYETEGYDINPTERLVIYFHWHN